MKPIADFDLEGTIFDSLEGGLERYVVKSRIGVDPEWKPDAARHIESRYAALPTATAPQAIDANLIRFLESECNFDVEHAEGSFFEHLYFCHEYSIRHYPSQSPIVMFLHSVLGTGTNTFAMRAEKIPRLRTFVSEGEWRHIAAFPSLLRLLYAGELFDELEANVNRLDSLKSMDCFRVIDNQPLSLTGEELFVQLNFQLIHLVDFIPAINWSAHRNDPSYIQFRRLHQLLEKSGRLEAEVAYSRPGRRLSLRGERPAPRLLPVLIPSAMSEKLAARAIRRFSAKIGHSLDYKLHFA